MPAFDGLLAQDIGWQATETAGLWHQVGFFTVHAPPTLYTLLVQGLTLGKVIQRTAAPATLFSDSP